MPEQRGRGEGENLRVALHKAPLYVSAAKYHFVGVAEVTSPRPLTFSVHLLP